MDQLLEFAGNHLLLAIIWLVLVMLIIGSWLKSKLSPIKAISPTELTLKVNRENAVVLDIRGEEDYRKGHITDARNVKLDQIDKQPLTGLEKQKDTPIIVVCQVGVTAQKAAAALVKQGYSQVSILQGGMNAWTGASLPVVKTKR
jgi:rhodanese-related sulfurtransferase